MILLSRAPGTQLTSSMAGYGLRLHKTAASPFAIVGRIQPFNDATIECSLQVVATGNLFIHRRLVSLCHDSWIIGHNPLLHRSR